MKPATSEIKPCPICGATWKHGVSLTKFNDAWAVGCDKCGWPGPLADTKEEAIELWNRRVGDQK